MATSLLSPEWEEATFPGAPWPPPLVPGGPHTALSSRDGPPGVDRWPYRDHAPVRSSAFSKGTDVAARGKRLVT